MTSSTNRTHLHLKFHNSHKKTVCTFAFSNLHAKVIKLEGIVTNSHEWQKIILVYHKLKIFNWDFEDHFQQSQEQNKNAFKKININYPS